MGDCVSCSKEEKIDINIKQELYDNHNNFSSKKNRKQITEISSDEEDDDFKQIELIDNHSNNNSIKQQPSRVSIMNDMVVVDGNLFYNNALQEDISFNNLNDDVIYQQLSSKQQSNKPLIMDILEEEEFEEEQKHTNNHIENALSLNDFDDIDLSESEDNPEPIPFDPDSNNSNQTRMKDDKNMLPKRSPSGSSFTGRAMERMTQEKLQQLFDSEMNYVSWENKYIQRKFHSIKYLEDIQKITRKSFENEKKQIINKTNENVINLQEILQKEENNNIQLQKRFGRFTRKHNGDKPLLILDVDNTMLYVRFFSEELRINDICTYFLTSFVHKNNAKIIKIRLTFSLEIASNKLIDKLKTERIDYFHWITSNNELKRYHKNGIFNYEMNENGEIEYISCKIHKVEVSGCMIQIIRVYDDCDDDVDIDDEFIIDFTESNDNLTKFEPCMERNGMLPVDFIYEGFLVRLRPDLDEFIEYVCDDFDVVIYTSANKIVYEGLLSVLETIIKSKIGLDTDDELWSDILYREDCILSYDYKGKPYYYKDLTLFGCDLSRVVMIDNSEYVCNGQQPNFILIKDFIGIDDFDSELMEVYQILDTVTKIKGDIRYNLCGLQNPSNKDIDYNVLTEDICISLTNLFIDKMKQIYYKHHISDIGENHIDIFKFSPNSVKQRNQKKRRRYSLELDLNALSLLQLDINDGIIKQNSIISDNNLEFLAIPDSMQLQQSLSMRDLNVIKREKLQKKRNKSPKNGLHKHIGLRNRALSAGVVTRSISYPSPTSGYNTMSPKPTPHAILKQSKHDDFHLLFLQQLASKKDYEIEQHYQQLLC